MNKTGQVVLFRIPQTDLEEGKLCPVLCCAGKRCGVWGGKSPEAMGLLCMNPTAPHIDCGYK